MIKYVQHRTRNAYDRRRRRQWWWYFRACKRQSARISGWRINSHGPVKNHPGLLLVKHPKTWHHQCQLLSLQLLRVISLQIAIQMATKMSFAVIAISIAILRTLPHWLLHIGYHS
jgi:hypothetical protein